MDSFQKCQICTKTNSFPKKEIVVVTTFSQKLYISQAIAALEKAHICPVWQAVFSKEEMREKSEGRLMEAPTLILVLHGLKDIVHLQTLYIESICRELGLLTFDVFSDKSWEKYQRLIA